MFMQVGPFSKDLYEKWKGMSLGEQGLQPPPKF